MSAGHVPKLGCAVLDASSGSANVLRASEAYCEGGPK